MNTEKKELTDNNELIAQFMGGEDAEDVGNPYEYHLWWDRLMPVIEKINEACKETGYPDGMEVCQWHVIAVAGNIKLVYFSVVDFIKWYNNAKI